MDLTSDSFINCRLSQENVFHDGMCVEQKLDHELKC